MPKKKVQKCLKKCKLNCKDGECKSRCKKKCKLPPAKTRVKISKTTKGKAPSKSFLQSLQQRTASSGLTPNTTTDLSTFQGSTNVNSFGVPENAGDLTFKPFGVPENAGDLTLKPFGVPENAVDLAPTPFGVPENAADLTLKPIGVPENAADLTPTPIEPVPKVVESDIVFGVPEVAADLGDSKAPLNEFDVDVEEAIPEPSEPEKVFGTPSDESIEKVNKTSIDPNNPRFNITREDAQARNNVEVPLYDGLTGLVANLTGKDIGDDKYHLPRIAGLSGAEQALNIGDKLAGGENPTTLPRKLPSFPTSLPPQPANEFVGFTGVSPLVKWPSSTSGSGFSIPTRQFDTIQAPTNGPPPNNYSSQFTPSGAQTSQSKWGVPQNATDYQQFYGTSVPQSQFKPEGYILASGAP
jgi:hypothetical protein